MDKKGDTSFSRFTIEVSQSADLTDEAMESQSPIFIYFNSPQHPNSKKLFCIEQEESQEMSIQNDTQSLSHAQRLYKCYKCYGVRNSSSLRNTLPVCEECQGCRYVYHTNALVSLLQRVLIKKIPQLIEKEEKRNQTRFEPSDKQSLKIEPILQNMKKISEDYEQQEEKQKDIECSLCEQELQGCYQICTTCQVEAKKFRVCSQCSQSSLFQHILNHNLELTTTKMQSKLPLLVSKPSGNSSVCFLDIEENESISSPNMNRDLNNSRVRSMIFLPQLEVGQSNDIFQNNLRTSEAEIVWSPVCSSDQLQNNFIQEAKFNPQSTQHSSFRIDRKEEKQSTNRAFLSASMVRIKMEESEDPSHYPRSKAIQDAKDAFDQVTNLNFTASEQQLTVRVAEQNKQEEQQYIFKNYRCDMCLTQSIKNIRHHCQECQDYDLCHDCFPKRANQHYHQHFMAIDGRTVRRNHKLKLTQLRGTTLRQTQLDPLKSALNFSLISSTAC